MGCRKQISSDSRPREFEKELTYLSFVESKFGGGDASRRPDHAFHTPVAGVCEVESLSASLVPTTGVSRAPGVRSQSRGAPSAMTRRGSCTIRENVVAERRVVVE